MKIFSVFILTSILLILITSSLKIYKVQTNSMADAITPGDYVVVVKNNLFFNMKSSDILAFSRVERGNKQVVFIKRVVASPGDSIISKNDGLYIKAKNYPHDSLYELVGFSSDTLDKDYLYLNYLTKEMPIPQQSLINQDDFFIVVPERSFFMIGDNYNHSMDSRFWGFIKEDQIIGKVIAVF